MRSHHRLLGALVALSALAPGCAGTGGPIGPHDSVNIIPGVSWSDTVVGTAAPPPPMVGGSAIGLVFLPLALWDYSRRKQGPTGPAAVVVASPEERGVLVRRMAGMGSSRVADNYLLAAMLEEAAGRWRVSPNAATSLEVHVEHVSLRTGDRGEAYIVLAATATLRLGTSTTGELYYVDMFSPMTEPAWRDDPAVFAEDLRKASRELARMIVQKLSR